MVSSRGATTAPLVVFRFRGSGTQLNDQAIIQQALDDSIQGSRAQPDFAAGAQLHFFENGIAVEIAASQRQQHMEPGRRQWPERFSVALSSTQGFSSAEEGLYRHTLYRHTP